MKINVSNVLRNLDSRAEASGEVLVSHIDYMGEDIRVNKPIKVSAVAVNNGRDISLTGKIKADLTLKCSRCLKDFEYVLETELEEKLSKESGNDDAIHFEGEIVDLTDIVLNNILLSLPMKPVCREDCKGLCPKCGSDMNIDKCRCAEKDIDPRFSVLKDLFKGD